MMIKMPGKKAFLLLILGLFLGLGMYSTLYAQEAAGPDRSVTKAKLLYDSGRYQDAFNELVTLLGQGKEYDPKVMVEIYKYLAFCYMAYERRDLSKKQFKNALKYEPALVLDPVFTSPKIMEVFNEAKAEFIKEGGMAKAEADKAAREKAAQPKPAAPPAQEQVAQSQENEPVIIKKVTGRTQGGRSSAGGAMARSIIPGWGQFYTGHNAKGGLFLGGAVASLTLTLLYAKNAYTAEDYYNQASPYEKKAKYDEMKTDITIRNVFAGVTVGIWAVNLIDAYFDGKSSYGRRAGLVTPYAFSDGRGSQAGINYNLEW
ncbi:MAG: hypothetical protein PHE84_08225 [bacterium]|nr:hypothetical protein [bacterium]